jgi:class 3 adenylate cyclase
MQRIADWLEKLGLGQYAQRFAENDITFVILPDLTDQDLKELGVASLGHRRQLLRAIGELNGGMKGTTKLATEAVADAKPHEAAERRQVTVMFSDLVGSTALSARIDPEDLRELISAYQNCVAETVTRFGGFVAKYMGDGALIYFGYPHAHEDDAERSVRAGMALIAAVSGLKTHAALQTRIGVATGLVVVGDLIGSGESQERGIVGETPNLAARLQSIAEPNALVIAESTRKLVGNLFELVDLGIQELKGISGPVRAWSALRPSAVESRFEALRTGGLTELVGREEELELLLRRWSKAKSGQGQVVLLSGEAGIGKSRITAALRERLIGKPHTQLRYFCSPQHKDSPLFPIISQMQFAAGFTHEDGPQSKLDKLEEMLAQTSTPIEDGAIFAGMLSLANDGRYPELALLPQQRREKTFKALISQIRFLARDCPVLMIFEDAHWIDPTSLEALGRAVDQVAATRVLLVVTFRPEFEPPWIGRPYVTTLTINRLAANEILEMIERVIGNKFLHENFRQDIIVRADGIPLFVEEITKAVIEAGSDGEARKTIATVPSSALTVPATLHASLIARLDRLGPAKDMAQIGAAIGRDFSHALLAAVASKSEEELTLSLDRLIAAGLLLRQGVPPHANYTFKHVLIRDAAYSTLLRARRQELHCRIVSVLQRQFADLVVSQPETIAHHCFEGGMVAEAIEYYLAAAQRATAASNNKEASTYVARGTTLLDQLPSSEPRAAELRKRLILKGWWFPA